MQSLRVDFEGVMLGSVGSVVPSLCFLLEIVCEVCIILLNSNALLSNSHAQFSLLTVFCFGCRSITLFGFVELIPGADDLFILLKDMPEHNEVAVYTLDLILGIVDMLRRVIIDDDAAPQSDEPHPLHFIHLKYNQQVQSMNNSQYKRKENSTIKKMHNSTEIDVLYEEFQSLKSQIYGVKKEPKSKLIETQWMNRSNKEKAAEKLRESTIHKCQQEFQENLDLIQSSSVKFKKSLFKRSSRPQEVLPNDMVVQLSESQLDSRNYSRKLKEYDEAPSINLEDSVKQSVTEDNICFSEGEQLFREFLSRMEKPVFAQLSASRREQPMQQSTQLFSAIQGMFAQITDDHMRKLGFLLQTLTFMQRKLHCLEMIIQEYGKILKAKFEESLSQRSQQTQLVFSVEALQAKYQDETKRLVLFYQQELKKQANRQSLNHLKIPAKPEANNLVDDLKRENFRLSELLSQAKCLIITKEELINALNEENQELKEEIDKLKKPFIIRGSAESSLGYSVTADKNPKKDNSSHEMELIAEKLHLALGQGGQRGWDEFEQGSNNDVNYSELQSVKDKSLDEWDISHLQLRQVSNAKSLQEDCLKIMRNKQDNDEQSF